MKRNFIAAAALLLGTSALASASAAQDKYDKDISVASKLLTAAVAPTNSVKLADQTDPIILAKYEQAAAMKNGSTGMGGPLEELDFASDKPMIADAAYMDDPIIQAKNEQATALKLGQTSLGMGGPLEEADGKPIMADADYFNDPVVRAKHDQALAMKTGHTSLGMGGPLEAVDTKPIMADADYFDDPIIRAKHEQASAMKTAQANGMGGPLDDSASIDLTPRPATIDYPPCSPGPGDDRCIQLYEPGVRAQLAGWNRENGGLADGSATAIGGPYEPVDGSMNDLAVRTDDKADSAEIADHSSFSGVGGPIEAQSGYPPCSPGPGDDRCIQLYESGVTGAGN